ncbi:PAS domain S-box protein [Fundidesulfovibrio terrae]|uniref:PAS domain S-box protein n=1 Tax=Fundidesulfovibrio terrae TaxID=2922866 RepID=UPI001FAF56DF|nr:PAS domain S-box protein [Fundidesulfovibrio terrae]
MNPDDGKSRDELLAELGELRRSHHLFQDSEVLAGMGSWAWDIERDLAHFSRGWLALHGLEESRLDLEECLSLAHPEDRLAVMAALRDALDGTAPFDIEYRIVRRSDGETRVVHACARVARDESGRPVKVSGFIRDITERAMAFRDLRRANDFLEQLIETANVLVVCLDKSGRILVCNGAVERATGYERDELLGRSWFDTVVPGDRYCELVELFQSIQTGSDYPRNHANPIVSKLGEERHFSWQNSRFAGFDGAFFTVSFGYDITEQVNAEKALRVIRKHSDLLSDFLENSSQPFLAMWPDGKIAIVNKAFSVLLGYSRKELLELAWTGALVPIENRQAGNDAMERLRATGQPVRFETCLVRLGGAHVPVEVNLHQFLGPDGSVEYYYAFVSDITERKSSRDRLQAAMNAVEAASRAKSEFLANMSHEIRTPLSAILGLAELSQRVPDPLKTARHLSMIAESAHTLLAIIGDVLDLSRVEAGKLQLDSKVFSLGHLVEKVLEPFAYPCREKRIELAWEIDTDVPNTLMGDPTRLGQVLTNLVGNALKFTDQGTISVSVRMLRNALSGLAVLQFTVTDTGVGIAPGDIEMIFDSFRQADSSYSKAYQGAGLGLAICRELVSLMGGRIWAESVPGRGSAFYFTAAFEPARGVVSQSARTGQAEGGAQSAVRILVAEDNPFNRHVFEQYLSMLGHSVQAVGDGQATLECLKSYEFDLVFLDVQMPKLDGLEVVGRIRAGECGERTAGMPVVALTAYAMQGDEKRFLDAGMTGYLAKPVTLEALQDAIVRHTQGGARQQSMNPMMDSVRESFRPMVKDFLHFIRGRADSARASVEAGDFAGARAAGHDIKGTSLAFGVSPINAAGESLERACGKNDRAEAVLALRQLDDLLEEVASSIHEPR